MVLEIVAPSLLLDSKGCVFLCRVARGTTLWLSFLKPTRGQRLQHFFCSSANNSSAGRVDTIFLHNAEEIKVKLKHPVPTELGEGWRSPSSYGSPPGSSWALIPNLCIIAYSPPDGGPRIHLALRVVVT